MRDDDSDDDAEPNLRGLGPSVLGRYKESSCAAKFTCALFAVSTVALLVLGVLGATGGFEGG